jgi:hypothetical protein
MAPQMKLTKDAQRVWDKLKADGKSDEEIFEQIPVWPHEYESEEEEKETLRLLNEHRERERAKRNPEEQKELDDLMKKLHDES